ncbi:hypothetical protein WKI71_25770 [Streptomyces sp. MS1.AVA.1]|uniref:Uncharacterized protein n=1 Tax=Streptomyces machairae TaxID=3134109 RepID=A0ABU8UNV4_9ACTN
MPGGQGTGGAVARVGSGRPRYGPGDRADAGRLGGRSRGSPASSRRPPPDEADRLTRDHVKDVLRDHLTAPARDWLSGTKLSLDVCFFALRRVRGLDQRTREDVFYAYGRGTMALDLGHRAAAARELARLRELRELYGA